MYYRLLFMRPMNSKSQSFSFNWMAPGSLNCDSLLWVVFFLSLDLVGSLRTFIDVFNLNGDACELILCWQKRLSVPGGFITAWYILNDFINTLLLSGQDLTRCQHTWLNADIIINKGLFQYYCAKGVLSHHAVIPQNVVIPL